MAKKTEDQQQLDPALEGGSLTDSTNEAAQADPAVAAKMAELESANAQLAAKNAATEDLLAKAMARLDALEAKAAIAPVATTPPVAAPAEETPHEKLLRKAESNRTRHYEHVARVDAALKEGPNQYRVSLEGENRMDRTVGASSELHAEAKFKEYFGITSTSKKLSVKLISQAEPVAPSPPANLEPAATPAAPASEGAGTLA